MKGIIVQAVSKRALARRLLCGASLSAVALLALPTSAHAQNQDRFWDANGAQPGSGGTGNWDTSTPLWSEANSDVLGPYDAWANNPANPDNAIFGVTAPGVPTIAGTVTLTQPIIVHNLTFQALPGWTLSGGTLTLAGTAPTINTAVNTTINSVIAGAAGLTKTGGATLTLTGTNSFSGGIALNAGTISADDDAALGDSSNNITTAAGATIGFALLSGTTNRTITLGTGGRLVLSGVGGGSARITGNGSVSVGTGVAMNNDASDYTGTTSFGACNGFCSTSFSSIADLGVASALGAPTTVANGTITWNQASQYFDTLVYTGDGNSSNRNWIINTSGVASSFWGARVANRGSGTLSLTGDIALTGIAGAIFLPDTADIQLLGVISGASPVYFYGSGTQHTVTLGGANTYSGDTTIGDDTETAGVGAIKVAAPVLANAGVASSLGAGSVINLTNGGTLSYTGTGGSSDRIFTADGAVAILNEGTGALTLGGPLSFTANGTADTLTFGGNQVGTSIFSGVISGNGNLASSGSSIWVLTGNNTRVGTITVNGGTLQAGSDSAFGTTTGVTVNSGTLDLNGHDLIVPQLSGTGGSVALNGGADLTVNGLTPTNNSAYAGSITGTGGLIKRGTNTLTLAGQSSYTGATTIQGGTLALNFAAASAPTDNILGATSPLVMAGGTFTITGAAGETNSQTLGGLNVTAGTNKIALTSGAGGSVNLNLGALTNSGGLLDFALPTSGNITTTSPDGAIGWATVNGRDYAQVSGGVISAFTAYTDKDEAADWLDGEVISDNDGDAASFSGTVSGSKQLGGLQYTTAQNSIVNIGTGNTLGIDGTIIVASSVGATTKQITGGALTGPVGGGTLGVLHNGTGNFLISSQIVDNGGNAVGLTKAGTGLLTVTNDSNSYTGATRVSGGTLSVTSIGNGAAASAIGASSAAASNLVLESGRLSYNGATATTDRGFTLVNGGPAREIEVVGTANLTFTGLVTSPDDGGLNKVGDGTLTLANAANDYIGITRIEGGTLAVGALANGGAVSGIGKSGSASANLVVRGGGTLQYTGATVSTDRGFTLESGDGGISVSAAGSALTMTGQIVGSGTLVKSGAGTLAVCGTNIYTGGTRVTEGTLRACSAQAFGPTTGAGGSMTVASGATLDLNGFAATLAGINGAGTVNVAGTTLTIRSNGLFTGSITGAGGVSMITGTQAFNGCTSSYTGVTTIDAAILSTDCLANGGTNSGIGASTSAPGNLVIQNSGTLSYTAVGANQITDRGLTLANAFGLINVVDPGTTLTFTGAVQGPGSLIKSGLGTLVLSGDNTYVGETRVQSGRLVAGSAGAFNQGTNGVRLANLAGAVLDLNGFDATFTFLQGAGAAGGEVDLGTATLTISNGQNQLYSGIISGTGNIVKSGALSQLFDGCNSTYTGTTTVSGGVLDVSCLANGGAASSMGASSAAASNLVLNGGTLRYSGTGGSTDRLFTLGGTSRLEASGSGAIIFTNSGPIAFASPDTSQAITLGGTSTADNALAALLVNNGTGTTSLSKTDAGTWILTNSANTYTGVTSITGGVLGVDTLANGGIASSIGQSSGAASNLVIGSGATLRYTGDGDTTDRQFTLGVGTTAIESAGTGAVVFSNTGAVSYTGAGVRVVSLGGTNTDDNIMGATIGDQSGLNTTSLAKNGTGRWALTGTNTYTGNTNVNAGTLVIGNGGTTGSIASTTSIVAAGAELGFDRADTVTFAGTIQGAGSVEQLGSGTTILTGANSYTGGTVISGGTLQLGNGGTTGSIAGDVTDNATLAFNRSDALVFNGVISGTGSVHQMGPGVLALSGTNTYSGGTLISGGSTLQVSSDANLGDAAGGVTFDSGTLQVVAPIVTNRHITLAGDGTINVDTGMIAGTNMTIAADITGPGSLTKDGLGQLVLTGNATHTGITTIASGALLIGDGGTTGSIAGDIVVDAGASVGFNRSDSFTYAGSISGSGSVNQVAGVTNLTGDSSGFSGTTNVSGGTLRVNGTLGNAASITNVLSGGTLGGAGIIGGNVAIADGGILAPGNSPGTMTINGNLALSAGSILNFEFGQANVPGGALNDLVNVGGNLTLAGTINVAEPAGGTFGPGIYRVFNYGGALTDNGLALGTLPTGSNVTVQTSVAGQVNLVNTAGLGFSFWDGAAGPKANSVINGGNGIWHLAGADANWTDASGAVNGAWSNGTMAIFAGAAGTVTVDNGPGAVTASGMQFATDGYRINGNPLTLVGPQSAIQVGDSSAAGAGFTATIDAVLAGATQLVKTDLGTLVLTGANSYTGGTAINGGTLQIASDLNLGAAAGGISFNGGMLNSTADFSSGRNVDLIGTGIFLTDAGTTLSFTGALTGAGELIKDGAGTLALNDTSSHTGGTTVRAGSLFINGDQSATTGLVSVATGATLGGSGIIGGNVAVADGATLAAGSNGVGTLTINGSLGLSAGSVLNYEFGQANVAGGALNDLVKVGGNLTLDGTLNVTVPTGGAFGPGIYRVFNYGGALTDNGLTLGTLPGGSAVSIQTAIAGQVNLVNSAGLVLSFWDGDAGPKNNSLVDGGNGVWRVAGATNNWTGQDGTINGAYTQDSFAIFSAAPGTVTVDNSGGDVRASGMQFASNGYVITGGALTLTGAQAIVQVGDSSAAGAGFTATIDAVLQGSAQLVKTDAGTLVLTGANTYSGGTAVNGGTLLVNGNQSGASGLTSVASGARLGGTGTIGGNVTLADGAVLTPGAGGAGTLTIGGSLSLASGTRLAYAFGQANTAGGALNDLVNVGGNLTLDGTIDVTVPSGGTFDAGIYRVFNYGGALTDNGLTLGTLPTGSAVSVQTAIAGQVNLVNNAGLTLNFWDGAAGPKNDNVVNGGAGVWQNSAGNGNWTDANGTVNAAYSDGSFAVFAGTAGTVTVDNSLGQVTSGGMQFAANGYTLTGGAVALTGTQATIRVGDGSSAGAGFTATIAAALSGDAQLVKTDAGTLVLSGTNSYTGGTAINGGTIRIAGDANLGAAAGGVTLNGGTLATSATMTSARSFSLAGAGAISTADSTIFTLDGRISGAGALAKAGGGTLLLTSDNSGYTGAATVTAGTLAVTGKFGGSVAVNSGGRLEGTGQVGDVSNAGIVAPGRDGFGTLTVGNYAAANGRLEIDAELGGDGARADLLKVNGATSGATAIDLVNRGGIGAPTVDGIKIVDVTGASNGVFTLNGDYMFQGRSAAIAGAYAYRLYQNGVTTPTDGDWYLRSSLLDPTSPAGTPNVPLYQPGTPVYEAYGQTLLALNELGTMQERIGNRQWAPSNGGSFNIWGSMSGNRERSNAAFSTTLSDVNVDSWKLEVGADHVLSERSDGATLVLGVIGGYGDADADIASVFGNGTIRTRGYSGGATLSWFGPQGFYVDTRAQVTWFDSTLKSAVLGKLADGNNGLGQAYSVEIGKRAPIGGKLSVTPQIQMVYSTVGFDRFTDPSGTTVASQLGDSLKTRWGLSLDRQDDRSHLYAVGNLTYEWLDGTVTDVSGTPIARQNDRLWGELGLGGSMVLDHRLTLYGEASADTALNDFGKSYSLKGTVGLRLAF